MSDRIPLEHVVDAVLGDRADAIDAASLRAVDRDQLAGALRRAVSGLPVPEQRRRLARAFSALAEADAALERAEPDTDAVAHDRQASPVIPRRTPMFHRPPPVRLGLLGLAVVVAMCSGIGLAALLDDESAPSSVAGPAEQPVPILEAVATGDDPPPAGFVSGLLPPDPADQAEAKEAALAEDPEGLGDDAADVDPRSEVPAAGVPGSARDVGYADGAGIFTQVPDGGAGGERESDTEPGADDGSAAREEDSAPPALVDLCAGDEPVEGCEGVAGTVSLAQVVAFRFLDDPVIGVTDSLFCSAASRPGAGQFAFVLLTNDLGEFTARWRPAGSSEAFSEVSGATPEIWTEVADEHGADARVGTCLSTDRPDGDVDRLEVDIRGAGRGESGTARWVGELELPPPPEPVAERPTGREARPPVTVRALNAGTLRVSVPLGRREQGEVSLVGRPPDSETIDCAEPPADTVTDAVEAARIRRIDEIVVSDWTKRDFDVTAPGPGPYAVCVAWLDDFDPPRTIERASVPVTIAEVPNLEVVLAGYQPAAGSGTQPDEIVATALRDGRGCGSERVSGAALGGLEDRSPPVTLCDYDGSPSHIGVTSLVSFGDDERTHRAIIPVPQSCTSGTACTTWFSQTIKAPDRSIVGSVVFGLRMTGAAGGDSVGVGTEEPELVGEDDVDGPRLDWDRVRAEPDPESPGRRGVVRWTTDTPAAAIVTARPYSAETGCPPRSARTDDRVTQGSLTLGQLCPGIDYMVGFDLIGERGRTFYDVVADAPGGATTVIRRSKLFTMEPLEVTFDYTLTFEEKNSRGDPLDRGAVPRHMELVFPRGAGTTEHAYRYSQWYTGQARFELDCAVPAHFNRAENAIPLRLVGGTFSLQESRFVFSDYKPASIGLVDGGPPPGFRRCPTTYNQFNGVWSNPSPCSSVIQNLAPRVGTNRIDRMLDGDPAVFYGNDPMCPGSATKGIEATVTVTMREVRTLRGTTG